MGNSKGILGTHRDNALLGCRGWGLGEAVLGDGECGVGAGFGGSSLQMQGAWLRCVGGVLVKGVGFKVSVLGCMGQGFAGQCCVGICFGMQGRSVLEMSGSGDRFGENLVSGSHLTQLPALQPKEGPKTPPSPCQCPPHCSPLPPPAGAGASQCQVPTPL